MKPSGLHVLDPVTLSWSRAKTINAPEGKLGHSAVTFLKKMVVYGGWNYQSSQLNKRKCSKKVYILHTKSLEWKTARACGEIPFGRRHHSSASLGKSMVVYGGYDGNSKLIEDLRVLQMDRLEWVKPTLASEKTPGPRAHCSLTSVFTPEFARNRNIDAFSSTVYVMESGFYLFGGLSERGEALNDLWVLQYKGKSMTWKLVEAEGAPTPRYSHTATYINSMLVICGGRNDSSMTKSGVTVSDLGVFFTEERRWESPIILSSPPAPRWDHCAEKCGSKLYLFGGLDYQKFKNTQIHMLETDQKTISSLL